MKIVLEHTTTPNSTLGHRNYRLILHRHRVGVHRLLAGNALQSRKDTAIVILVALHGKPTLLVTIGSSHTYEMLLGLA